MPLTTITREQVELLALQSPEERARFIARLAPEEVLGWEPHFESWRNDGQVPPADEHWRTWLIMAGRGFGKTRAGAQWVHGQARRRRRVRIALVGATIAEARSVMVEGPSGLIAVAELDGTKLKWEPSTGRLKWPGGATAQIFSGDNANGLRGPEHDYAWCDELAKWGEVEQAWTNLQLGLRRGRHPRVLITTTPRPIALLKTIASEPWTVTTGGRTADNLNLDKEFIDVMTATYGGTRIGRQELDGELIEDVAGALWPRPLIEASRAMPDGACDRVVVGVDPPAGANEGSDACGIVVAGRRDGILYVLADESIQGLSPEGWSSRVAMAAERWGASLVVAEANNGGAMVKSVLTSAEAELRVRLVHASKGKAARAEPIALQFETGKAKLAGHFPELEAELAGMVAGGEYQGPGGSPDRADAMVWALTQLGETRSGLPRVARL